MARTDTKSAIIIAASSANLTRQILSILPPDYSRRSAVSSSSALTQKMTIESYDLLVVCSPLQDDAGVDAVLKIAEKYPDTGVLFLVKSDVYDQTVYRMGNSGVMVLSRPMSAQMIREAITVLDSVHRKLLALRMENQRLTQKLEDEHYISRAKALLIEREKMTEPEAHHLLEKTAMDEGITKREAAVRTIRNYGRIITAMR